MRGGVKITHCAAVFNKTLSEPLAGEAVLLRWSSRVASVSVASGPLSSTLRPVGLDTRRTLGGVDPELSEKASWARIQPLKST